ncbi:MAG: TIGR02099 family protein, partial [Gammaproteobacteria bacterium]|nr:TIGR02099 family protein [Gammaproteobacteria bacterium]
ITDGNIIEAEAGAGRLLGLFSLSALPRKLFGDFADTFKSGFNFDTANGEIIIDEGNAYTEDFLIRSPVAEVTVSGRTGLAARDYDNIIKVVPELGGGIAGVTALLVNLPAGIGVWLIDKLTGEKINKASTRIYEVSGSWDKPVIQETGG